MGWVVVLVVGWIVLSPIVALVLSRSMRDRRPPRHVAPAPPPARQRPRPEPTLTDDTVVVAAHGLASSCDVVIGAGETLRTGWDDMAPEQRDEVLGMMIDQAKLVQQVLHDLTRGMADDVRHALDNPERPLSLPTPDADGAAARP
jgi:hypothetical protein